MKENAPQGNPKRITWKKDFINAVISVVVSAVTALIVNILI